MILHPAIVALELVSFLVCGMILYSAFFGIRIIGRWDLQSGSEEQLALERRTYLISTILSYILVFQIGSLFLYIYTADSLHNLFVGAMCAAGSLYVDPYGYPTFLLKITNCIIAGVWLIINHVDNQAYDYPLIRKKYSLLLLLAPLITAEAVSQWLYFAEMKADVITSCCGSLFSSERSGVGSDIAGLPAGPVVAAFYGGLALTLLSGFLYLIKDKWIVENPTVSGAVQRPRRTPECSDAGRAKTESQGLYKNALNGSACGAPEQTRALQGMDVFQQPCMLGYLFSFASSLFFLISCAALISFISLYFYELPTHHCPFCILQREYGYIGYLLYGSLLCGVVSGIGVGVLMPFRRIASLSRNLAEFQKRLTLICLVSYLLFAGISSYRMVITDFTLGLFG
jgi:hypothetical protein